MSLLAHQGGWDEILLFAAPVLVVLYLLRWAERRSRSVDIPEVDGAGVGGGSEAGDEIDEVAGEEPEAP